MAAAISVQPRTRRSVVKAVLGIGVVGSIAAAAAWMLSDPGIRLTMQNVLESPAGFIGLFVLSALSSATLFLPAPGLALTVVAASIANPLLVGVVAGLGQTLGELTGYVAGRNGGELAGDRLTSSAMGRWMRRRGGATLFVLALVPNPVFDMAGILAGALRLPITTFLLSAGGGKILRNVIIAWAVAQGLDLVLPS